MGGSLKDRITVVEAVYHRSFDSEPRVIESRFSRELKTTEQVYTRRSSVGEEWQPLDHGWIEECGMLVVQNDEGRSLQVNLSEEERKELSKKILEVTFRSESGLFLIPPGESLRGCPSNLDMRIRSRSGVTRFTVNVLPG